MEISAVLLARAIALFDVSELSPRGAVFAPGLIPLIAKRFNFQTVPKRIDPAEQEDDKKPKGIIFEHGYFEGNSVSNLTIYTDGIKIDVLSSTKDAKKTLLDSLYWLSDEAGITFSEKMLNRWAFLSNLVFQSSVELDIINPALAKLGTQVSQLVTSRTGMDLRFRPSQVKLDFDRTNFEMSLAPFVIERRAKALFTENKYYSSAPLETHDHIRLLEEFEENVKESRW